jgi:hypothetical protein
VQPKNFFRFFKNVAVGDILKMYNQELVDTVIADKFRIVRRIGGGSFGEIYLCVGPNGTEVLLCDNNPI